MKKIIITIGKNSQTIFLLIVLVIGLVILLNMIAFFYKKHKNPRFSQKEFLNNIFYEDQSQVYVLVRKKDYKVLFFSSHFEEVFHILPKRIQVDIEVLKEIVEDDTYRQFLKEYKQWNQQEPFKYSFKMKDENKWFILTITAIEHGKYHLFAFYDHSEDVLKELDYLQQIETTKNESEYKASFLSRMSHEIRTPMNGIIGMLTLARQSKQDAKQGSYYLQQAEDISKYLLSLINEVLDMSRMEAGKLELESKPFNIYHLKAQLNNIFKETIEKKNVLFKIDYFDFDVKYFMGDELRIMQILVNLLSNASKFTDNGEITVTFRQMYKEDKVANIMMRVHDTGKGMSREFLSHIFRPFEQEGVEISKKYGGSGLGMAITDQLVKLMGGEIVVDSLEGKGTDFTVFLNLPVAPSQEYEDEKQALIHQREVYEDVDSFDTALKSAMREDPDVILVGEMRDYETIQAVITLAETGHLVFSTLHTIGAPKTIDRIIDVFPPHKQAQIRAQLASVLQAVVTQQLLPLASGKGRAAALEIMIANDAIKNLIRENKGHQIDTMIQTGRNEGMTTLNASLATLVNTGKVNRMVAERYSLDVGELRQLIR